MSDFNKALKSIGYTIKQTEKANLLQALCRTLVGAVKESVVEFLKTKHVDWNQRRYAVYGLPHILF